MGALTVAIEVGDLQSKRFVGEQPLVDTGASYLTLPSRILRDLNIQPSERRVEHDVAFVTLRLEGHVGPVLCVFSPDDMQPLLGVVPLETFGLGVDPIAQRLISVVGLLKSVTQPIIEPPTAARI